MDRKDQERLLAEAKRELAAAQRQVLHLQQLVDGLSGLLGGSAPSEPENEDGDSLPGLEVPREAPVVNKLRKLRPREAVLEVLREHPGVPMSPAEVYSEIRSRGMHDFRISPNAYNTAMRRLADEPGVGIVREGKGRYIYRESVAPASRFTDYRIPVILTPERSP